MLLHVRQMMFGERFSEVSKVAPQNECTERKQVKRSATLIFILTKKKHPPPGKENFKAFAFCFWDHPVCGLASICI